VHSSRGWDSNPLGHYCTLL